jgi:hypothetical protein
VTYHRPMVATVLSARPWEARLVAMARAAGSIRVVGRLYQPEDLDRLRRVDVLVVGAETSWATPARVRSWRDRGIAVLGVVPEGDKPAAARFTGSGALVTLEHAPLPSLLASIRLAAERRREVPGGRGRVAVVVGTRGAPGVTEVAFALASGMSENLRTLLVDLDLGAPTLGLRLGLPLGSGLAETSERLRCDAGSLEQGAHRVGAMSVVPGEGPPSPPAAIEDLMVAARSRFEMIVADRGPVDGDDHYLIAADAAVLVCIPSPTGLVRTARLVEGWSGPIPWLVVNRVGDPGAATLAVRRFIGLEPAVLLEDDATVGHPGSAPSTWMVEALRPLHAAITEPAGGRCPIGTEMA